MELRQDQLKVKRDIYHRINNGAERVMVKAVTGFGKTVLAASIIQDAVAKGRGVLFVTPLITLVNQTLKEFERFGLTDIGVIQANHERTNHYMPIQIATPQSLASIQRKYPSQWNGFIENKVVIIDEAHIYFDRPYKELLQGRVIGLSATPWRKGLGLDYQELVPGPSLKEMINEGNLCDYVAYSHYQPDMKGVTTTAGDFSKKESGEKYTPQIIGDIYAHWKRHAYGLQTLLFAPRVADAERFAQEFRDKGIRAVAVSGYMDNDLCALEVERFRAEETTVLCSVSKLATGFNVTNVQCIIDAQPTKSLMRHIQKLGRGLRTDPKKSHLIILDNAGNICRNGAPDGDFPTYLDEKKPSEKSTIDKVKDEAKLPTVCADCGAIKTTWECPKCGFKPKAVSKAKVLEGQLVQIKRGGKQDKREVYLSLLYYSQKAGYKSGWAAHMYRSAFNVWPKGFKGGIPIPPSPEILSWIKAAEKKKRA